MSGSVAVFLLVLLLFCGGAILVILHRETEP